MGRKKSSTSEWTIEICYCDYETGKEIDINQLKKEERVRQEKIIVDRAFAKVGYLPVDGQGST